MVLPAWAAALAAATARHQSIHHRLISWLGLGLPGDGTQTRLECLSEGGTVHGIPVKRDIAHAGKECSQKAAGGASIDAQHSPTGGF